MLKSKLPDSWQTKRISEFTEVITGGTPSTMKKEYWENGDIPWLPSGDLKDKPLKTAHIFITKEGLKNSAARMMPKKTVLIALTGATTGQTAILEIEASANQSVTGILPSKEHIPEFLFYYLRTIRNKVIDQAYGGGQPHISQGFVKNLLVPLPPLPIQKQIVSILDKVMEMKQKREEADKLTKEHLQSVFYEMFWKKEFQKVKLKDLTIKIKNRNPQKDSPETYFSYIDISSVDNINKRISSTSKLLGKEAPSRAKQQVKTNDIILSTVRPNLNAVALIPKELNDQICSTGFCVLRFKEKNAIPKYIFFNLINNKFIDSMTKIAKGASYPAISDKDIFDFEIPLPPLELQQKFASIVEQVEKLKERQKQSKEEINVMFDSLMKQAFNGELIK